MSLSAADALGPYEILAPIGAGGMGEVYRARDTRLDREVAVKVLPERFATDPTALSRFEREAKAVAALSHPNVLAVYDVGRQGKTPFVVTELLEGETLRQRVNAGPLPWRKAVEIAVAVVDGLAAAHAKGIVHRDLKPENIFLTTDGVVKILDFGLARMTPEQGGGRQDAAHTPTVTIETRPGTVIGTLNYMSPEQLRGLATDARSDVFSFGCVLYEMVAGRRAFRGETSADTMTAILRETPSSVRNEIADVGVDLERVIDRCLEKKAEQRFHSASDLAFTLKSILADSGTHRPAKAVALKPLRSFGAMAGAAALVLIVVGVFLVYRSFSNGSLAEEGRSASARSVSPASLGAPVPSSSGPIRIAVLPFADRSPEPQEWFASGITDHVNFNLAQIDGLWVPAYQSVRRLRGTDQPISDIAGELDVTYVVLGSVIRGANELQIRVQLVEAATETQIWSDQFARDDRDYLGLQNEVARAIASAVEVVLTPQDEALLAASPAVDAVAYEEFMHGLSLVRRASKASLESAIEHFDEALARDPGLALAYVGKASAYQLLSSEFHAPRDAMPYVKSAAESALAIDENLAEAYCELGHYWLSYEFNWDAARDAFEKAIDLNPSLTKARIGYAMYLTAMKRGDEAMRELDSVHERDRNARLRDDQYGMVSYMARRYDRSIRDAKAALQDDPDWWAPHLWLGLSYSQLGKHDDAVHHMHKLMDLSEGPGNQAMAGGVLAVAGGKHVEEAKAIYDSLKAEEAEQYVCPYELATIPIGLGDYDTAFHEMDRACEARADCLPWLQVDPRVDPIRDDPRFDRLLMRVGFEPQDALLDQLEGVEPGAD